MKSKSFLRPSFFGKLSMVATTAIVASALPVFANNGTWTGGGSDATWNNSGNWSGGTIPGSTSGTANTDTATFSGSVVSATNPVVIDSTSQNIGSIAFSGNGVSGAADSYTIGTTAGNSLFLTSGGAITVNAFSSAGQATVSYTDTVNAPLVLEGSYTLGNSSANAPSGTTSAGTLVIGGTVMGAAGAGTATLTLNGTNTLSNTISGVISDGSATSVSVLKSGAGRWILSGPNTYSGGTTITAGALNFSNASALGSGGVLLGDPTGATGASLEGVGTVSLILPNNITVQGTGSTVDAIGNNSTTGAALMTYSGTITMGAGGVAHSLTINSSANENTTISGNIVDPAGVTSGAALLVSAGNSLANVKLSGTANTFTGGIVLTNGLLQFNNSTAAGTGTITINGGGVGNSAGGTLSVGNTLIIGNNFAIGSSTTPGGNLTLTGAATMTKSATITDSNGNLVLGGNITDNGGGFGFTLTDSVLGGSVGFNGNNTFGGGVTVAGTASSGQAETLKIGNLGNTSTSSAIGTGTLTFAATSTGLATIDNTSGAAGTLSTKNVQVWNGAGFAFAGSNNLDMGTGSITLSATVATDTITVSARTLSEGGIISNGATGKNLSKAGTGTLVLYGANAYTGTTAVTAGSLIAKNASALGTGSGNNVTTSAGASLNYNASTDSQLAIGGTLAVTGGAGSAIGGSIGSTATSSEINVTGAASVSAAALAVNVYGDNNVTPLAGTNNYTLVSGGAGSTLNGGTAYTLGTVYNNANFTVGALTESAGSIQVAITSATELSTAYWKGGLTGNTNVWAASNGSTASNWTTTPTGAVQALTPGAATDVIVSATSPTTAPTATVLGANMTIHSLTIADTTNGLGLLSDGNTLTVEDGGITMNASVPTSTIGANVALGASQTWTNNSANNLNVSGIVSGGAGSTLTTAGTGTVVLSGVESYTGPTIVSGGTLAVSGSLNSGSAVSVNAGTLKITGTVGGTISLAGGATLSGSGGHMGALTIASGGIINTVDGGIGTLNGSTLALNGNANFDLEIGSSSTADLLNFSGAAVIGSGDIFTVNVTALAGAGTGTYTIASAASGLVAADFAAGTLTGLTGDSASFALSGTGDSIELIITAGGGGSTQYYFNGATSGTFTDGTNYVTTVGGGTAQTAGPSSTSDVFLNATGATATDTLTTAATVNSLTYLTSGSTLAGSGTLTLAAASGTGITDSATGGTTENLNPQVALGSSQSWSVTNATNTLAVNGGVTGTSAQTLSLSGPGTFNFTSGNSSGAYNTTVNTGAHVLVSNSSGSAFGQGKLTVQRGASIGGSGKIVGLSSFALGSGGTGTTLVQVGSGGTNTSTNLVLEATGASTIANTQLNFNISVTSGGSGSPSFGSGLGAPGSGNELVVGTTSIGFGSGVSFNLNLVGSGIIQANTPYVLVAGSGGDGSGTLAGSQFSGAGLSTTLVNGLEQINGITLTFANDTNNFYSTHSFLFLDNAGGVDDIEVEVVPEPSTWALMFGGLAALVFWQRRKSRRQS